MAYNTEMLDSKDIKELPSDMKKLYDDARQLIEKSNDIKIYTHTDCDGLCSGAILSEILDRLGKKYEIEWVNLDELNDLKITHELTIFSDLGSGQEVDKNAKSHHNIIILDHHPPLRDINYQSTCNYIEINPIHHGIDGSYYICGGGLCYLLGKEFGYNDLSWIGVLSAIGDIQNGKTGKLEGLNSIILNDCINEGLIKVHEDDLNIYARKTRPLLAALSYFSDVKLPFTNNQGIAKSTLLDLDIDPTKTLSQLSQKEKNALSKHLFRQIIERVPGKYVEYVPQLIIADAYEFLNEDTENLKDVSEFSTAMNACGRNEYYEIAHKILKGNRTDALDCLEIISKNHKRNLATNIEKIHNSDAVVELDNIQYFDGDGMAANIVGTVTGMILGDGNWRKPMIGFSQTNEDYIKISLRCSKLLSYDNLHFGHMIREISQNLGGSGGGHAVACGAYIPIDKKEEFLEKFNNALNGIIEK